MYIRRIALLLLAVSSPLFAAVHDVRGTGIAGPDNGIRGLVSVQIGNSRMNKGELIEGLLPSFIAAGHAPGGHGFAGTFAAPRRATAPGLPAISGANVALPAVQPVAPPVPEPASAALLLAGLAAAAVFRRRRGR